MKEKRVDKQKEETKEKSKSEKKGRGTCREKMFKGTKKDKKETKRIS